LKNKKGVNTMKNNIIIFLISCVFISSIIFAKEKNFRKEISNKSSAKVSAVANGPDISLLNINQMAYWIGSDGAYTTSGSPNAVNADYPIFAGGLIFSDGVLWGSVVKDSMEIDETSGDTSYVIKSSPGLRVGGSTKGRGLAAGRVIYDSTGNVIGADDPSINHVWRVRKDWATADLSVDAASFKGYSSVGQLKDGDVEEVRAQYRYDWENWPAAWGAPYDDVNENGFFDEGDIPGYPGADQTVWIVANDVPTKFVDVDGDGQVRGEGDKNAAGTADSTVTYDTAPTLYGSDAIGVELQVTLWGYALGAGDPLGNVIFKKAKMVYTGTTKTPSRAMMDDIFFTQWSDPDLGTYTDDYVGCDTTLSFGYVYNGNRTDGVFDGIYNLPVPAGGFDFFQGPPDNKDIDNDGITDEYLPMTSFTYFGAGSAIDDPDAAVYDGSLQFYNLMNGLLPRPEWPNGQPWTDPITGEETVFVLSGDPVAGTGWVDGINLPPGDRRMVMSSGPFMLNRGDTAEVVLGIVGGLGLDNLSSIAQAKFYDKSAQYAYNVDFDLPSAPSTPNVIGSGTNGAISLDWGFDENSFNQTEVPINKGFEFEGYVVYQLPSGNSPLSEGVKLATFDKINDILAVEDDAVNLITGEDIKVIKQLGSDGGIQRFYHTNYDEIRGRPMSNGITYYFAVTAYNVLPDGTVDPPPFKTLESPAAIVPVTPSSIDPGFVYSETGMSEVEHAVGISDASVEINIANSDSIVGGDYEVSFREQEYYRNRDGLWISSETRAGKVTDCTSSSVSAVSVYSFDDEGVYNGDLDLIITFNMGCGNNLIDGIQFDFTDLVALGTINSFEISGDGPVCSHGNDCTNLDGTLTGSSLLFGVVTDTIIEASGLGAFEGSNEFTVTYSPSTSPPETNFTPFTFNWTVYDDAYDGTYVNATGTVVVSELAYERKKELYWTLTNTTSGNIVRKNQTYINGSDLYGGNSIGGESDQFMSFGNSLAQIPSEGLQVFINGSYDVPLFASDQKIEKNYLNQVINGESSYIITDYYRYFGDYYTYFGDPSSKAIDILGFGVDDINTLQKDIDFRFTGEFDDVPMDTIFYDAEYNVLPSGPSADTVLYFSGTVEKNGGSYAWLISAEGYSLTDHPEASAEYEGGAVRIWIPFEVWDMEARDANGVLIEGGTQIDIAVIDGSQGWNQDEWAPMGYIYNNDDECCAYSWNPYNGMYTFNIHTPYKENGEYLDVTGEFVDWTSYATWNLVWLESQFNQNDVVRLKYDNPIQPGIDKFTFSTIKKSTTTDITLDNVSVYPNPYYGFHQLETGRGDKYVSFNNLPSIATIDIYSLGGVFVRSLKHSPGQQTSDRQFARWDLNNQYGYPVASGLYIARITSDGAKEKVLKIALVQETQVLKYY